MAEPLKVYVNPVHVAGRLDELGLKETTLTEAVVFGEQYRLSATAHDPKSSIGMAVWGKTNRGVRDRLSLEGWSVETDRGYELTVHPSREHAIAVAAGDWLTGIEDEKKRQPSTSSAKGPVTRETVERSQQASFKAVDPAQDWPAGEQREPPQHVWLLLYHADQRRKEIRIELSRPAGMTSDNYVNRWHERIILTAQPFGTPPPVLKSDKPSPQADSDRPIEVQVERREQSA